MEGVLAHNKCLQTQLQNKNDRIRALESMLLEGLQEREAAMEECTRLRTVVAEIGNKIVDLHGQHKNNSFRFEIFILKFPFRAFFEGFKL